MDTPLTQIDCDICVIGAGAGGLSVAAGASQMGANVVLIEKGEMGGECLNSGCVPSKALLSAAKAAQSARRAARFGVKTGKVSVKGKAAFLHIRDAIAAIAPNDSQDRFEKLGVTVLRENATFTAPDCVRAGETEVHAKYFVVATGSHAFVPPIEGMAALDPLTTDTVFGLNAIPQHLIVIGAGAVGCEMAQAFRGLGAEVTLLEGAHVLALEDEDAAEVVRTRLLEDGVVIHENARVSLARGTPDAPEVVVEDLSGRSHIVAGSHILVAAGRRASVMGLGLERAGVDFSPQGIEVDRRLRSIANRRIFAVGDVAQVVDAPAPRLTHVAGYHAGVVIKNALFKLPAKVNHDRIPHVVYTDPELAQVGWTEAQARARLGNTVKVFKAEFNENDRALCEGETEGFVKALVGPRGKILGCTIVGPGAGELIAPWTLAMEKGLKIGALAATVAPYPTFGEISKRAAGQYFTPSLYGLRVRAFVRFMLKWMS